MLDAIFERFVKQSPVSAMVRALMERVFNKEQLDSIFENHATRQYRRELLFSLHCRFNEPGCLWHLSLRECCIPS
jgi:hypothetical protein